MQDDDKILRDIFDEYCRCTGLPLKYGFDLYTDLYLFAKEFEAGDICVVVNHLRKIYKAKPEILRACLRFRKLLGDRASFGEYLAEARAEARAPVKTEKQKILEQVHRPDSKPDGVRSAGEIINGLSLREMFKKELERGR